MVARSDNTAQFFTATHLATTSSGANALRVRRLRRVPVQAVALDHSLAKDPLHHARAAPRPAADLENAHALGLAGSTGPPFALALASPALTLSRIMPRSNSANTPSI